MSSVIQGHRYDQSGGVDDERQVVSIPETTGQGIGQSVEFSQERPYTEANSSKRLQHLMFAQKTPNSTGGEFYQRNNKIKELLRTVERKEEVIKAQRTVLGKMFGKLSNFERTLRITRNIVKKLKNRLLESGIPLPDVDDETADQLFANGTVQDKLEEALIGYQNITPLRAVEHSKRQSIDPTSFETTPLLSQYDNFVLKQLEKAEMRAIPAMKIRKTVEQDDTNSTVLSERKSTLKKREVATEQKKERSSNSNVKRLTKNRSNLKQRAVSTGRQGVERLPRLRKAQLEDPNTTFSPSSTLLDPGVAPPSLKRAIGPVRAYRPTTTGSHHSNLSGLKKTSELYYKIDSKFREYLSQKLLITLADTQLVKSEMQTLTNCFVAKGAKENFFHKTRGLLFQTLALFFLVRNVAANNRMEVYLPRMVEMLAEAVEAERCAIYLYDKLNDELYCRVITGIVDKIDNLGDISIKRNIGVHGEAFSTGTPIYVRNAYADSKFDSTLDTKLNFVTRNLLVVPIVFGNKAIGVLEITNKCHANDFTECDLALIKQVTAETAIGITAFEMKQNIQKEFEEEIAEVKGLVGESHNRLLKPLTAKLSTIAKESFSCDSAIIYYHDPKTEEFWTYAAKEENELSSIETHFQDMMGFAGQVLKTKGRPLLDLNPLASELYYKQELAHLQIQISSLLAYPVFDRTSTRIIAVIELINLPKFEIVNQDGPSKIKFSQGSEELLKSLCTYISELHFTSESLAGTMMNNDLNDLLLQALNEGVVVVNSKGTVTRVNKSVAMLFQKQVSSLINTQSSEMVGSSIEELFGSDNPVLVEVFNQALATDRSVVREMCSLLKHRDTAYGMSGQKEVIIHANVSCVNVNETRSHLFGFVLLIQPVLKASNDQRVDLPHI